MDKLIVLILRELAKAIAAGLDPVAEIRERLEADPTVDTALLDDVLAKMEAAGAGEEDDG